MKYDNAPFLSSSPYHKQIPPSQLSLDLVSTLGSKGLGVRLHVLTIPKSSKWHTFLETAQYTARVGTWLSTTERSQEQGGGIVLLRRSRFYSISTSSLSNLLRDRLRLKSPPQPYSLQRLRFNPLHTSGKRMNIDFLPHHNRDSHLRPIP